MIDIELIGKKIEALFNGTEPIDNNSTFPANENYFFKVATAGFEIKEIFDMRKGKNFIPVFVSAIGGTFTPVPNLREYEMNTQIELFFPVRLKDDFYGFFTNFLLETFVSKILTFENGEKALCNVGVPQYGEIEQVNMMQFQNWVSTTYKKPFQITEQWMSMTFTLFVKSSNNENYLLGNDVEWKINYKNLEMPIIIQNGSLSYNANPQSEQIIGEKISKSIISTSADGFTLTFNIEKNNPTQQELVYDLLNGTLQNNDIELSVKIFDDFKDINCIATSLSIPVQLGMSLQMTIVFSRKVDI